MKYLDNNIESLNKWRLILGKYADNQIELTDYREIDDALEYLYGREYSEERGIGEIGEKLRGGSEDSILTIPQWITKIRELFPKQTVEIMEKHALEKYNMYELLSDKEVLEKLEPNMDLLKNILSIKHLVNEGVLLSVKNIIRKVVKDIQKELEVHVKASILGQKDTNKRGYIKSIRNIDFKRTIKQNLKNYDIKTKRIIIQDIYFNSRIQHYNKWNIIIAVDESGSMCESIIYSAVMAGIFAKLPVLKTNLIIFDTQIVDLSNEIGDPVETLMKVQLGGGTFIAKALNYCFQLIENPNKTIVVMVTDLYEGGSMTELYRQAINIIN